MLAVMLQAEALGSRLTSIWDGQWEEKPGNLLRCEVKRIIEDWLEEARGDRRLSGTDVKNLEVKFERYLRQLAVQEQLDHDMLEVHPHWCTSIVSSHRRDSTHSVDDRLVSWQE